MTKTLTQSLRIQKFENNKLVEDRSIPDTRSGVEDLLQRLSQLHEREKEYKITDEEKRTRRERWNDWMFAELPAP